jgi:hypothetical protein
MPPLNRLERGIIKREGPVASNGWRVVCHLIAANNVKPLVEIDHWGERVTGCLKCNRWQAAKEYPSANPRKRPFLLHSIAVEILLLVREARPKWAGHARHFDSLRRAIDFEMHELTIAGRTNAWITTENGNLTIQQIERLQ